MFLIHDCMNKSERVEILDKLKNDFDIKDMSEEIFYKFKKYELAKKLQTESRSELRKAESFLKNLEIDTTYIRNLTIYSNL